MRGRAGQACPDGRLTVAFGVVWSQEESQTWYYHSWDYRRSWFPSWWQEIGRSTNGAFIGRALELGVLAGGDVIRNPLGHQWASVPGHGNGSQALSPGK